MFGFGRHGFDDVLRDFARMQRTFDGYGRLQERCSVFPPVNVYDDGEAYIVTAEMPGVAPEDLSIEATSGALKIKGERKRPEEGEGSYHRRERDYGVFNRTVELNSPIDPDQVKARYENGVLEVVLPRAEAARPRQIAIA